MFTSLKNFFLKNWIPKLACLLVATGLWFWVAIQQSGRVDFQVPIDTINTPENLFVADESTRQVTVTLQGPKTALYRTSSSDIMVTLNLAGQTAGTKVFWRSDLSIQTPQNVQVYDVSPRNIRMKLVQRSEKVVPVQPRFEGSLSEGLDFRTTVDPDTALIVGSTGVTGSLQQLHLTPINLTDRESGENTMTLKADLPGGVNLKYPSQNRFEIKLDVFQIEVTRTFEDVPVTARNVPPGMQAIIEPSSISLTLTGPKTAITSLQTSDIDVSVSAPSPESGLVIRVPNVNLPQGIEMVDGEQTVPPLKVKLESK